MGAFPPIRSMCSCGLPLAARSDRDGAGTEIPRTAGENAGLREHAVVEGGEFHGDSTSSQMLLP
jgi:hypothetical protein